MNTERNAMPALAVQFEAKTRYFHQCSDDSTAIDYTTGLSGGMASAYWQAAQQLRTLLEQPAVNGHLQLNLQSELDSASNTVVYFT